MPAHDTEPSPRSPMSPLTPGQIQDDVTIKRRSRASTLWGGEQIKIMAEQAETMQRLQRELEQAQTQLQIETEQRALAARKSETLSSELVDYKRQIKEYREKLQDANTFSIDQEALTAQLNDAKDELFQLRNVTLKEFETNLQEKTLHNTFLKGELQRVNTRVHKVRGANLSISSTGSAGFLRSPLSAAPIIATPSPRNRNHQKSASTSNVSKNNPTPLFSRGILSTIDSPPTMAPAMSPTCTILMSSLNSNNSKDKIDPAGHEHTEILSHIDPYQTAYSESGAESSPSNCSLLQDMIVRSYLVRCHIALAARNLTHLRALCQQAVSYLRPNSDLIYACDRWSLRIEMECELAEKNKLESPFPMNSPVPVTNCGDEHSSNEPPTSSPNALANYKRDHSRDEGSDGMSANIPIALDRKFISEESYRPSTAIHDSQHLPLPHERTLSLSESRHSGARNSISRRRPSRIKIGLGLSLSTLDEFPVTSKRIIDPVEPENCSSGDRLKFESGFSFPPASSDILSQSPPSEAMWAAPRGYGSHSVQNFSGRIVSPVSGTPGPSIYSPSKDEEAFENSKPSPMMPAIARSPPTLVNKVRIGQWLLQIPDVSGIDMEKLPTSKKTAGLAELAFPVGERERAQGEIIFKRSSSAPCEKRMQIE